MPKRYLLDGQYKSWNITKTVGYGGGASNNDTKLVQYLLNCYQKLMVVHGKMEPGPELVVDGLFGPNTSKAVWRFQKRQTGAVIADGKISQMQGHHASVGSGQPMYGLAALELSYTMYVCGLDPSVPGKAPGRFNEAMDWLPFDDDLDSKVRAEMFKNWDA